MDVVCSFSCPSCGCCCSSSSPFVIVLKLSFSLRGEMAQPPYAPLLELTDEAGSNSSTLRFS